MLAVLSVDQLRALVGLAWFPGGRGLCLSREFLSGECCHVVTPDIRRFRGQKSKSLLQTLKNRSILFQIYTVYIYIYAHTITRVFNNV